MIFFSAFRATLVAVLLTITGAPVAAQPGLNNVPAAVRTAFAQQFNGVAPTPSWNRRHGNCWEAAFRQSSGKAAVTTYAADGTWLQTAEVVSVKEIPTNARAYLLTEYAKKPPRRAARVTHADGTLTWQAYAGRQRIVFDRTGHLLRAGRDAKPLALGARKRRTAPILDGAPAAPAVEPVPLATSPAPASH